MNREKIEIVLLVLILRACSEAALAMVRGGMDEFGMEAEAAEFLHDLLCIHPKPEVANFYRHELETLW
jgi:hypothetical protein